MKKNERNAGRKPMFTVPSKKVLIPICIENQVNELSKSFKTKKNENI